MAFHSFLRWVAPAALAAMPLIPAFAQDYSPPATAAVGSQPDPIDTLSAYLRTLAASPRDYAALIGAGSAALQVGDPNAALGFFARAEQIDRRSGRAKAGLASALVALERPDDALPLFAQALSLGMSESDIARDRGLAYDLRGDTTLAQRDYALAMKRSADDETVRRYALSLGISGQRAEAMTLLAPLLLKKDQSAWRARSFILAMTGDLPGANGIARQVMPANLAAAMTPFLTRLAALNAADRAHAVNFGTMPANGAQIAKVQIGDPFAPARAPVAASRSDGATGFIAPGSGQGIGAGLIPVGEALGPRPGAPILPTPAMAGAAGPTAVPPAVPAARPAPTTVAAAAAAPPAPAAALATPAPAPRPDADTPVFENRPATPPVPATSAPPVMAQSPAPSLIGPPASSGAPSAAANTGLPTPIVAPPAAVAASAPQAALPGPGPVGIAPDAPRLASVLDGVTPESEPAAVALPSAEEIAAQRRLTEKRNKAAAARAAAEDAEKAARAAEAAKTRANPARLWVQVATGNNTGGLGRTWAQIRDGNAAALKGRTAYSVPFKATNRLLVGPMKSVADARALVGALAKGGVSAMTFSSGAGQEVARVPAK